MGTKIGLLSSNKTAVIYSSRLSKEDLKKKLSLYSERELFEVMLMVEYLLLKMMRKEHPNHHWVKRLERQHESIQSALNKDKRINLMKKLNLTTSLEANQYGKNLLFPWFR